MDPVGVAHVSVVIPMRNAERFVKAAVVSILEGTTTPIELVVVNDGSTDNSQSAVESISDRRVRIVPGPCRGIAAAVNVGLSVASGRIIMFCDADDLYVRHRIDLQVAWLDANPSFDAVCGRFEAIDFHGALVAKLVEGNTSVKAEDISPELLAGTTRTHLCTYAIRRQVIDVVGMQREFFETAQDIDFQLRLGERCKVGFLPICFYSYRLHEDSITHTQSATRRVFFETLARSLQQERLIKGLDCLDGGRPPAIPPPSVGAPTSAAGQIQDMMIGSAWQEFAAGRRGPAIKKSLSAVMRSPARTNGWRSLAALLAKAAFTRHSNLS